MAKTVKQQSRTGKGFECGYIKGQEDAIEKFRDFMYEQEFSFKITSVSLAFVNYWINKYKETLKKENDNE